VCVCIRYITKMNMCVIIVGTKMIKREAWLQTRWNKYLLNRWEEPSGPFELKVTLEKSWAFDLIKPHQLNYLYQSKHGRSAYKIADDSIGYKPCDCIFYNKAPAYMVIMFYTRGCDTVYVIDIDVLLLEIENSPRKSLTESRAQEIGRAIILN